MTAVGVYMAKQLPTTAEINQISFRSVLQNGNRHRYLTLGNPDGTGYRNIIRAQVQLRQTHGRVNLAFKRMYH